MKVLMFNGSPKAKGCTYTALDEMAKVLNEEGIETEWDSNPRHSEPQSDALTN